MPRVTNANAGACARNFSSFYGSNLSGGWEGDTYIVYSYAAPILVYSKLTCKWFMTKEKFSKTTSKHLSQVSFAVQPQPVQHDELLQIIIQPKYVPLTEPQKMGIDVGDLCRITHSNGVFRKGSIVRVESTNWWDTVNVSEVLAVRTKRYADTYWNEPAIGPAVRLHALERING